MVEPLPSGPLAAPAGPIAGTLTVPAELRNVSPAKSLAVFARTIVPPGLSQQYSNPFGPVTLALIVSVTPADTELSPKLTPPAVLMLIVPPPVALIVLLAVPRIVLPPALLKDRLPDPMSSVPPF